MPRVASYRAMARPTRLAAPVTSAHRPRSSMARLYPARAQGREGLRPPRHHVARRARTVEQRGEIDDAAVEVLVATADGGEHGAGRRQVPHVRPSEERRLRGPAG